jgi:hypothetical protein
VSSFVPDAPVDSNAPTTERGDILPWREATFVLLIAARAVALSVVLSHVPADPSGHYVANDAVRYTEIAETPGTPYRDFDVEIPPVEQVQLELVASPNPRVTAVRNAWLQFVFDILVAFALVLGWGVGAALLYLLIGLPLAPFLYFRLDLLSVALASAAMAFARRKRPAGAGALLAAAFLAKVWPATLVPALFARRRWKTLAWAGGVVAAGMLVWVVWTGTGGPMQVATFRGATGWQLESTPGSLLLAGTDLPVVFEAGANRIAHITFPWRLGLELLLLAALGVIAWAARRHEDDTDGLAVLAAVSALLVTAPILSWQYVAWLLPWTAIVALQRRWVTTGLALVVLVLSTVLVFQGVPLTARGGFAVGLLLTRNAALIGLPIAAIASMIRRRNGTGV